MHLQMKLYDLCFSCEYVYVCVLKGLMNVHEPYDIKGSSVCSWVQ